MTGNRAFVPEFGANGTVLNSPQMTNTMRNEILRGTVNDAPPLIWVLAIVPVFGFLALGKLLDGEAARYFWFFAAGICGCLLITSLVMRAQAWRVLLTLAESRELVPPPLQRRMIDALDIVAGLSLITCVLLLISPFKILPNNGIISLPFLLGFGTFLRTRGWAAKRGWLEPLSPKRRSR